MALDITSLLTALSSDQVQSTCYSILTMLGFSTTSWRSGSISRTLVSLFSLVVAPFTALLVVIASSGFLDFATLDALTILAAQFFNVTREGASFAAGALKLTNAGGGVYTYATNAFQAFNSTTGAVQTNTAPFTLNAATTLTINVQAVVAGSGSTSNAGAIDTLQTTLIGVTCSNAGALVGDDAETDTELRLRCRSKLASLSPNGPAAAYDFVARSSALNGGVTVTRTQVEADSDTGSLTIQIANDSGSISSPDVALVQTGVDTWCAPQCIEPTVVSATPVLIAVACTVYISSALNLTTLQVQTLAANALTAFFPTVPIGGFAIPSLMVGGLLPVRTLEGIIRDSCGAIECQLTGPTTDTLITIGTYASLNGAPTVAVIQVAS